jgi:hypothetical protein
METQLTVSKGEWNTFDKVGIAMFIMLPSMGAMMLPSITAMSMDNLRLSSMV